MKKNIPYRNFYLTAVLVMLVITVFNGYFFFAQKGLVDKMENMGYVIDRVMANCEFNGQMLYSLDIDVVNHQAIGSCLGNCVFNGSDFNCDVLPEFLVKMDGDQILITQDVK